jgi:hypothetical protein
MSRSTELSRGGRSLNPWVISRYAAGREISRRSPPAYRACRIPRQDRVRLLRDLDGLAARYTRIRQAMDRLLPTRAANLSTTPDPIVRVGVLPAISRPVPPPGLRPPCLRQAPESHGTDKNRAHPARSSATEPDGVDHGLAYGRPWRASRTDLPELEALRFKGPPSYSRRPPINLTP